MRHLWWSFLLHALKFSSDSVSLHFVLPYVKDVDKGKFMLGDGTMVKLGRRIDFPVTGLDMSQFVFQRKSESFGNAASEGLLYNKKLLDTSGSEYGGPHLSHLGMHQPKKTSDAIFVDTATNNPYVYDLFAIVHHMGTSIDSGHYTATTRNPMDGKWRHYDDMSVKEIASPAAAETSTVYLLFYERRSGKRLSNSSSSGHSSTESGIQEHWFNRRAIDLSVQKRLGSGPRRQSTDQDFPNSSRSKEGSPVTIARAPKSKNSWATASDCEQKNEHTSSVAGSRAPQRKNDWSVASGRQQKSNDFSPITGLRRSEQPPSARSQGFYATRIPPQTSRVQDQFAQGSCSERKAWC